MVLNYTTNKLDVQARERENVNWDILNGVIETVGNMQPKVTQAGANATEALNKSNQAVSTSNTAKNTADSAKITSDATAQQLENIILENGTNNAEVVAARIDMVTGQTYTSLSQRLDNQNKFNVEKISKLENDKGDKSEVNKKVDRTYFDMIIANLVDGSPRELFYSVAALQTKYPNGEVGTYLVFDSTFTDGAHTFMWNGTSWEDLGIYQALELADESVTVEKVNFIYKEKSDNISFENIDNLFNIPAAINPTTGATSASDSTLITDFIDISDIDFIFRYINDGLNDISNTAHNGAFYKADKTFHSGITNVTNAPNVLLDGRYGYKYENFPADAKYIRLAVSKLVMGNSPTQHYHFDVAAYIDTLTLSSDIKVPHVETLENRILAIEEAPFTHLADKNIAIFGDSVMEFGTIPNQIANLTGATVYDCSVGGTRMGKHSTNTAGLLYNELCMYRLADAVASGNYTNVLNATNDLKNNHSDDNTVNMTTLSQITWSEIDYVLIAFGTNDYAGSPTLGITQIGTNNDNLSDGSTFKGAINHTIATLLTAYPHLQIVFTTPIYRHRLYAKDDNLHVNGNGDTLTDFANAIKDVAAINACNVIDLHTICGINKYTYQRYLSSDQLHPSVLGYEMLAKITAKHLTYN